MKKVLKKNQIIITALVVMVAIAGYMSMTDKEQMTMSTDTDKTTEAGAELTDISDEDIVLDEDDSVSGSAVTTQRRNLFHRRKMQGKRYW